MPRKEVGKPTKYPGVTRLGVGQFRVRAEWKCPKTGRRKYLERIVEVPGAVAASRLRDELKAEALRASEPAQRLRVADYARSWLTTKLPTLKASTQTQYATVLEVHVLPALGDYYMDTVTKADIIQWRNSLPGRPASINGRLRVFKTMFRDAVDELELPKDPTSRVEYVRDAKGGDDEDSKVLTADELRALLEAAQEVVPQWYPLILALATTGGRFGAVSALKWQDIDFDKGLIRFRRAHWHGHVDTTKTGAARTVPLDEGLAEVLKAHRRQLMESQAPGFSEGWVFPSRVGRLSDPASLRKPLDKAIARAGLTKRPGVHWFRHTLSNLLRQATTGQIQRSITGHVTEQMSEHYSHVDVEEKRAALNGALRLVRPSGD